MTEASVVRVTEISAKSTKSIENAIHVGIARAQKTLRNVTSAWIKEQRVTVAAPRGAAPLSWGTPPTICYGSDEPSCSGRSNVMVPQ
jgi:flavin-binding protein dodecin